MIALIIVDIVVRAQLILVQVGVNISSTISNHLCKMLRRRKRMNEFEIVIVMIVIETAK